MAVCMLSSEGVSQIYVDGKHVATCSSDDTETINKYFNAVNLNNECINDNNVNPNDSVIEKIPKMFPKNSKKVQIGRSIFYVPDRKKDLIQGFVHDSKQYFEQGILYQTNDYIPKDAIILDIGANIGNHTLYWANECNAKKIYAFEPVPYTFKLLKKNIKLNNLQDVVQLYNFGLSDKICDGEIQAFDENNIGGTRLQEAQGTPELIIPLKTLDSLDINEERIDLIKIDVEAMDPFVVKGALNTIKKYKPIILIESFPSEYPATSELLFNLGYKLKRDFGSFEYMFVYEEP